MLIRIGYDIELGLSGPTALIFLLQVHPDRARDLVAPEHPVVDPPLWTDHYTDSFGNRCALLSNAQDDMPPQPLHRRNAAMPPP